MELTKEESLEAPLFQTLLWRELKEVLLGSLAWSTLPGARRMILLTLMGEQWQHSVPREVEVAQLRGRITELEKRNAWLTLRNEELSK